MIPIVLVPQIADLLGLRDCLRLKWATKDCYEMLHNDYSLEASISDEWLGNEWGWDHKSGNYYIIEERRRIMSLIGGRSVLWTTIMVYPAGWIKGEYITLYFRHFETCVLTTDPEYRPIIDKILN
jgi:hypothetical protein